MKPLILTILVIICNVALCQTEAVEKKNMTLRFQNGEFTAEEYQDYAKDWRRVLHEMGGYPILPFDSTTQSIKFEKSFSISQPKKVTYNRILEWAAIHFGAIDAVLHYKNFEDGKIILKGWFEVKHKTDYRSFWGQPKEGDKNTQCFQTYVFTIKENALKIEIMNVRYKIKYWGYYSSNSYIPERDVEISIHAFYPITNSPSNDWKEQLDLMNKTNLRINTFQNSLIHYIENYSNDYNF